MIREKLEAEIAVAKRRRERVVGFAMDEATFHYLESEADLWEGNYVQEGVAIQNRVVFTNAGLQRGGVPVEYYPIRLAKLPIGEIFAATERLPDPLFTVPSNYASNTTNASFGSETYYDFNAKLNEIMSKYVVISTQAKFTSPAKNPTWLDDYLKKQLWKRR